MEKYQGWTNWDTWNANLWLTNEEHSYEHCRRALRASDIEEYWEWCFKGQDGVESDNVNWHEIFESFQEE